MYFKIIYAIFGFGKEIRKAKKNVKGNFFLIFGFNIKKNQI